MNVILLLLLVSGVVCYDFLGHPFKQNEDQLVINQLEDNQLRHLDQSRHVPTRASRVQGGKARFCGKRLAGFIFATCGECQPGYSESLSLLCCARPCDIQDIINACCPNEFRR
ncbi:CBN-INS-2 protein [Caenorhabditis brenneri]|uniref:CBN-INS-2 protein n=1 Tax=Caenorhabditis brenneri TaxID=135651 RepID=G0MZE0_CAEBE|nr:CBN-INS-2 protein [Caenorhabditis brenneri]